MQCNNQNEEISYTKWENVKKVVTTVASEVVGYEERKKRNDWYDEECQIKVEERNKVQIKMLNRTMRMDTENNRNRQREAKKMCRAKKKTPKTISCRKVWRGQIKDMKQENSIQ